MGSKFLNLRKNRGFCPFLTGVDYVLEGDELVAYEDERQCKEMITKDYFAKLCSTKAHVNCKAYAKRMDELAKPIEWLQREAVAKDKIKKENEEI